MAGAKHDPNRYTEDDTAAAIKGLLSNLAVEWYSTEAGYQGHFLPDGTRVDRRGGTRTTPGIPDLFAYLRDPVQCLLTLEFKGERTDVRTDQWRFALRRSERGEPHLIVRSPQAMLWGLRFLGLLPHAWVERPPALAVGQSTWETLGEPLPVNVNYLPDTRSGFWLNEDTAVQPSYCRGLAVPRNRLRRPPYPRVIGARGLGPNSPLR